MFHFTDVEIEAQRKQMTCPRSLSQVGTDGIRTWGSLSGVAPAAQGAERLLTPVRNSPGALSGIIGSVGNWGSARSWGSAGMGSVLVPRFVAAPLPPMPGRGHAPPTGGPGRLHFS